MHPTLLMLGCVVCGQVSEPVPENGSPATVEPAVARLAPPEMVAEALMLPPQSTLSGRPLTLLAAVSAPRERRRQLEVTRAYWRLAEAVAVYRFCLDHHGRLEQTGRLEPAGTPAADAILLRTARAAAAALLQEAELAAVSAQHELAAAVPLPSDSPLPLPADPPHVGSYRTRFDELFASRTSPGRLRMIDRTLPIRQRAIEGRAAAVRAADDAMLATIEAYGQSRAELSAVLVAVGQYLRQRRAWIASVCQYNRDIADYAIAVVGVETNGRELVEMLIKPAPKPLRPLASRDDRAVQPAGLDQPIQIPDTRPKKEQPAPTPAIRPGQGQPAEKEDTRQPTPATRWSPSEGADEDGPKRVPPLKEPEKEEPVKIEPEDSQRPIVPIEPDRAEPKAAKSGPAKPALRRAAKPAVGLASAAPSNLSPPLYPALAGAKPAVRAKQLTLTLHWDRALPEGSGEPVGLLDCLRSRSAGDRRGLIEAYWLARQRAAEYQVVAQQAQLLEDLVAPGGGTGVKDIAALRLRAARLTTAAALHEAHAALVEAQFELAERIGLKADPVYPLPKTVPHCGSYLLNLDAQPRRLVESWPLRRLAVMIPGLWANVRQRAAAVVEADAARANAAASYHPGDRSIEPLLASISRQTEQTLTFVQTLTDYNLAIAEYALSVLAPGTPDETLVQTLVVVK